MRFEWHGTCDLRWVSRLLSQSMSPSMTQTISPRTLRRVSAVALLLLLTSKLAQAQGAAASDNPYGIGALWSQSDVVARTDVDFNDWVDLSMYRATERVQRRLSVGLSFLATVGSTSPFVGLFGTVWGIYHALTAIGLAGQASIDKVAGPVGEALIMTALGLAVAVPAVLGYNFLLRRNSAVLDEVRDFSSELHAVLLGSSAAAHSNAGTAAGVTATAAA